MVVKKSVIEGMSYAASSLWGVFWEYLRNRKPLRLFLDLFFIIALVVTLSAGWIISTNFKELFLTNEESKFQGSIEKNSEIQSILQKVLNETSANRAYLYNFHDGTLGVGNLPFFYMSEVVEVVNAGTSREILNNQRLPLSLVPNIQKLKNGDCISVQKIDSTMPFSLVLVREGTTSFSICPVFNLNNTLVGFVGIDFVNWNSVNPALNFETILKENSKFITGALAK